MRHFITLFITYLLLMPTIGMAASQADVREISRMNNCQPKKIKVISQTLGVDAITLYNVECILPKSNDDNAPKGPNAIIVRCSDNICDMLRSVINEDK